MARVSNPALSHNALAPDLLDDMVDTNGAADYSATSSATAHVTSATASLYITEVGDTSAISINDLHQGQIGDCFLISSIGEIALHNPSFITNMIRTNADGTETVTLYTDRAGRLPTFGTTAFKATTVTVNNVFPTYAVDNGASQDVVDGVKELWPAVIEKAVATLDGGYGAIANGGNPVIAMEELTGHTATPYSTSQVSLAQLQNMLTAGDLITMDSSRANPLYNVVGSHAYMLKGLTTVGGLAEAVLANPWGYDQPAMIPVSQLSKAFVEIDVGHV